MIRQAYRPRSSIFYAEEFCSFEQIVSYLKLIKGGGPRVVVSTAAFHARVRGSVPGLGGLKETKNVSSPSTCESQYCGEPP